ncbi:MAG: hypothetical protein AAF844_15590 [Pseudomonadota bacterium]
MTYLRHEDRRVPPGLDLEHFDAGTAQRLPFHGVPEKGTVLMMTGPMELDGERKMAGSVDHRKVEPLRVDCCACLGALHIAAFGSHRPNDLAETGLRHHAIAAERCHCVFEDAKDRELLSVEQPAFLERHGGDGIHLLFRIDHAPRLLRDWRSGIAHDPQRGPFLAPDPPVAATVGRERLGDTPPENEDEDQHYREGDRVGRHAPKNRDRR